MAKVDISNCCSNFAKALLIEKALNGNEIMKRVIIFLTILFLICIATGCAEKGEKGEDNRPIKIAINVWPGYAHVFIAQEKGFFKENNVDVELILAKEAIGSLEIYKNVDLTIACISAGLSLIILELNANTSVIIPGVSPALPRIL